MEVISARTGVSAVGDVAAGAAMAAPLFQPLQWAWFDLCRTSGPVIIGRAGASPPSRTAAIIFLYIYIFIYLFIYLYIYICTYVVP